MWIEDWVGKKRVPGQEALMKWRGVVKAMREARPRSQSRGRGKSRNSRSSSSSSGDEDDDLESG